jgi:hypothetical protein
MKNPIKHIPLLISVSVLTLIVNHTLSAYDRVLVIQSQNSQALKVNTAVMNSLKKNPDVFIVPKGETDLVLKTMDKDIEKCAAASCYMPLAQNLGVKSIVIVDVSADKSGAASVTVKAVNADNGANLFSQTKIIPANEVEIKIDEMSVPLNASLSKYIARLPQEPQIKLLVTPEKSRDDRVKEAGLAGKTSGEGRGGEDTLSRERLLASKAPMFRIGYGGFGVVQMADSSLNKYYKEGQAVMAEYDFLRFRTDEGHGIDLFGRYTYRSFKITDSSFRDFKSSPPSLDPDGGRRYPMSRSSLVMHGGDIGFRLNAGAYFLMRWDIYLSCAYRFLYVEEKADNNLSNTFMASGVIGGAGIEMAFVSNLGLFAEYQIGYTPVGKSNKNVEGHQLLFGMTFRVTVR